jgi:hypothetical protein
MSALMENGCWKQVNSSRLPAKCYKPSSWHPEIQSKGHPPVAPKFDAMLSENRHVSGANSCRVNNPRAPALSSEALFSWTLTPMVRSHSWSAAGLLP